MNKKIILCLGSLITTTASVSLAVACGCTSKAKQSENSKTTTKPQEENTNTGKVGTEKSTNEKIDFLSYLKGVDSGSFIAFSNEVYDLGKVKSEGYTETTSIDGQRKVVSVYIDYQKPLVSIRNIYKLREFIKRNIGNQIITSVASNSKTSNEEIVRIFANPLRDDLFIKESDLLDEDEKSIFSSIKMGDYIDTTSKISGTEKFARNTLIFYDNVLIFDQTRDLVEPIDLQNSWLKKDGNENYFFKRYLNQFNVIQTRLAANAGKKFRIGLVRNEMGNILSNAQIDFTVPTDIPNNFDELFTLIKRLDIGEYQAYSTIDELYKAMEK